MCQKGLWSMIPHRNCAQKKCTNRSVVRTNGSDPLRDGTIILLAAKVDAEPCGKQAQQHCGKCWLRLLVLWSLTLRVSLPGHANSGRADGTCGLCCPGASSAAVTAACESTWIFSQAPPRPGAPRSLLETNACVTPLWVQDT